ncbi:protein Vpy, partial [Trichinella spiralis]|uniref:protein Vpy n=1 Tax=Trichinella spiralis TaxID=6334 RepID=UPI0001EFE5E8
MHHPEGKHGLNSQGNQRHALHPDLARRVPVSLCSNRRHHEMTFRNLWEHDCISIQNQNGLVQCPDPFSLILSIKLEEHDVYYLYHHDLS